MKTRSSELSEERGEAGAAVAGRRGMAVPRETARALPIALMRAREAIMSRFRPFVAGAGFTDPQWRVLRVLDEAGPLDPTQIAEAACILMPSLSRILRSLEEDGMVSRTRHPSDNRSYLISITPKAQRYLHKLAPQSNAIYDEMERIYGRERMQTLLDLLEDLDRLKLE